MKLAKKTMESEELNEFRIFGKNEIDFSNNITIAQALGRALNTNIKIYKDYSLIEKLNWFQNDSYAELSIQNDSLSKEPFYVFKYNDLVMLVCKNWIEIEIPDTISYKTIKHVFESENTVNETDLHHIINSIKSMGVYELYFCNDEVNNLTDKMINKNEIQKKEHINNNCIKMELKK